MLIYCKECEHECSDKAEACPNCGCPLTGTALAHPVMPAPRPSEIEILAQEAERARAARPPPVMVQVSPLVQTTERTAKIWKLVMLVGGLLWFGGCAMCTVAVSAADGGDDEAAARVGAFFTLVSLLGLVTLIFGKLCAWWYHG